MSAPSSGAIPPVEAIEEPAKPAHPIRHLVVSRTLLGLLILLFVSMIVFAATELLPGNAAYSVLGQTATPESLAALEHRLGLDQPALVQYLSLIHISEPTRH